MKSPSLRLLNVDIADIERAGSPDGITVTACPRSKASEKDALLPKAVPVGVLDAGLQSRAGRLALLKDHRQQLAELAQELKEAGGDAQRKAELFRGLTDLQAELQQLQVAIADSFVPQHSQGQLISPQDLLVSRLFNVRNKAVQRERLVQFDLMTSSSKAISYSGPELRQAEGFVFMALVNLARDYPAGTAVAFESSKMCHALYGYCDTRSRLQLKESIKRLMQAVLTFPDFSVQLAQRFTHPARGNWSVALDPQIVRLFSASNYIWLDLNLRRELTEGLATWLYGYVRGQPRLAPTSLEQLRDASGSDARTVGAFQRSLYPALRELVAVGVLEEGARVVDGVLHWRRPAKAVAA